MRIYTLIIDHKHGTNIYNFLSEKEMQAELYSYVFENWYEEDGDITKLSEDEAINAYFHENTWVNEWYQTDYIDNPILSEAVKTLQKIAREPIWGDTEGFDVQLAKETGEFEDGVYSPCADTESSQLQFVVELARETIAKMGSAA